MSVTLGREPNPEADAKTAGIGDREVAQPVAAVSQWGDDVGDDFLDACPPAVQVRDHDANVGHGLGRKRRRVAALGKEDPAVLVRTTKVPRSSSVSNPSWV